MGDRANCTLKIVGEIRSTDYGALFVILDRWEHNFVDFQTGTFEFEEVNYANTEYVGEDNLSELAQRFGVTLVWRNGPGEQYAEGVAVYYPDGHTQSFITNEDRIVMTLKEFRTPECLAEAERAEAELAKGFKILETA